MVEQGAKIAVPIVLKEANEAEVARILVFDTKIARRLLQRLGVGFATMLRQGGQSSGRGVASVDAPPKTIALN